MKKFLAGAAVIAVATTLCATAPAAADSAAEKVATRNAAEGKVATGKVVVFSTEVTELTVWEDPEGCVKLPVDAHVLVNQTDKSVTVYGDPFCISPDLAVAPGYGSHVAPGSGAFSVDR